MAGTYTRRAPSPMVEALISKFNSASTMAQYRALKCSVAKLAKGGQLLLVDTMIEARARLEEAYAKTAPSLPAKGAN